MPLVTKSCKYCTPSENGFMAAYIYPLHSYRTTSSVSLQQISGTQKLCHPFSLFHYHRPTSQANLQVCSPVSGGWRPPRPSLQKEPQVLMQSQACPGAPRQQLIIFHLLSGLSWSVCYFIFIYSFRKSNFEKSLSFKRQYNMENLSFHNWVSNGVPFLKMYPILKPKYSCS